MTIGWLLHLLVALAIGWAILSEYRWLRDRSTVIAAIVAATIVVRGVAGAALFWISDQGLPFLKSYQEGGGFWLLAPDARGYFIAAHGAAIRHTLLPLDHVTPSPAFDDALALMMMAVGATPPAGMLLNLCLYVGLMALLVWYFKPANDWRLDLPCIVAVIGYSAAPVILVHSTQPLKDELSNTTVALASLAILGFATFVRPVMERHDRVAAAIGAVAAAFAVLIMAGIRWYFGFIMWASLALTLVILAARGRQSPLLRYSALSAGVLVLAWWGFELGAGPNYWNVRPDPRNVAEMVSRLRNDVVVARTGFLNSGGGTNIVVPLKHDADAAAAYLAKYVRQHQDTAARINVERDAATPSPATAVAPPAAEPLETAAPLTSTQQQTLQATSTNFREHVRVAMTGLAIVFLPIFVVRAVTEAEFTGGRGLLPLANLDTIFLDVVTIVMLVLVWKYRHRIGGRRPLVVFALVLSVTTALLLGYVVTNYGTLWRMRPLVTIPLWLLAVAVAPRGAVVDAQSPASRLR